MIPLVISILLSYLVGSIPTSFLLGKLFAGVDIRKMGSGNVGATNVYRVVGRLPGVLTLVVDIAKGIFAVTFIASCFHKLGVPIKFLDYQILIGLAVIAGHNWTVFLNFRGGKGIATSTGVLSIICPKILLISAIAWVIVFAKTKIVSLASVIASIVLPVVAAILGNTSITLLTIILCIISVFKHKSNIQRLLRGEEKALNL